MPAHVLRAMTPTRRTSSTLCKLAHYTSYRNLNITNIFRSGNKIAATKKKAKLSSAELRKKKKDRMARRKRGEEVFTDEDEM